jgi:hypothetical protein
MDTCSAIHVNNVSSEPLHQVAPYGPHPGSFSVYVHGNREQHARKLDAADSEKRVLGATGFQPVWEEQREDEAVQDV